MDLEPPRLLYFFREFQSYLDIFVYELFLAATKIAVSRRIITCRVLSLGSLRRDSVEAPFSLDLRL